jgi:hypothetical protein
MKRAYTATSYEFTKEWFQKAQKTAASQGKSDSAALWRDGMEHLEDLKAKNDQLREALEWCAGHGYSGGKSFGDVPLVKKALNQTR